MTGDGLLAHITAARWFGGKGRSVEVIGLTPLPWLRPPGQWPAVRQEIVELGYPGSDDHDFYQLLIGYQPKTDDDDQTITAITDPDHGELVGVDGTEDPAVHDALLGLVLTGSSPTTASATVIGHREGGDQLTPRLPSRVFGGEQSNTSILYAHLAILKLFRRIEIGRNLDVQTHDVLTRTGSTDIARLYGWIEGSWSGPDSEVSYGADLAMLTELLPDARDGWEYALAELRTGQSFAAEAQRLGHTLAGVHELLRANFPTDTIVGDQVAAIMNDRLQTAVVAAPQLAPYTDGLSAAFDSLSGRRLEVQRVHGDFHLGQTLHTPSGWKIIDFEGEPAKTLAERSRPDSVWRDIAGALRSFDYAAAHHPGAQASSWANACEQEFLAGYGATDGAATDLLRAYLADKAVYEVVYEARNRPDWVDIPLTAVAAIAEGSQHDE